MTEYLTFCHYTCHSLRIGNANRSPGMTTDVFNHLKSLRTRRGLTQSELASLAGITRQAVSSIESNLYLPTTTVALRLASALNCRVEDLFSLASAEEILEGTLVGHFPHAESPTQAIRVKVSTVSKRTIVRPAMDLGEQFCFAVPADGYLTDVRRATSGSAVRVKLSRNREAIKQDISVAGCDPAIFLAGEHLRRQRDRTTVVGWTMGSMAALQALQRKEVHVAGLHLYDPATGESNLPFLRQSLKGFGYDVITFAAWEEGFLVRPGNPLSIRTAEDLAQSTITLINREKGSGARLLLDHRLRAAGIPSAHIRGYDKTVASHFDVARAVAGHQADVGLGVRSAARHFGLDFVPLQTTRYDLVVPKSYLKSHPTLAHLFDTLVSQAFRSEIEALGGYDTSETGKVRSLRVG